MPHSKIEICNIALGLIGESSIRSFDENNSRARLCDNFFEYSNHYLMSIFDWPFARGFKELKELAEGSIDVPEGYKAYQIPADCLVPRDIHPKGTDFEWELVGEAIVTRKLTPVHLYYTKEAVDTSKYSRTYVNSLADLLAARLAHPIRQDKALARSLFETFSTNVQMSMTVDANIGSEYRHNDERPELDKFVHPDGFIENDFNLIRR